MHGSETWPMKVEHELKMNCTEMSMIRWMCGVKLNEIKKIEELRELLGLEPEPVSLMIEKSRLRRFVYVERKDDNVKRCMTWKVEGIRQRGRPNKTWWDCVKNDMEILGLSQKDVQFMNKWRRRIYGGNQLTQVHLEKWPLKRSVCVCVPESISGMIMAVLCMAVPCRK